MRLRLDGNGGSVPGVSLRSAPAARAQGGGAAAARLFASSADVKAMSRQGEGGTENPTSRIFSQADRVACAVQREPRVTASAA
jgi:hypothetical protein